MKHPFNPPLLLINIQERCLLRRYCLCIHTHTHTHISRSLVTMVTIIHCQKPPPPSLHFFSSLPSPSVRLQSANKKEGPVPIMLCRRKQEEARGSQWAADWTAAQRKPDWWWMQRHQSGRYGRCCPPFAFKLLLLSGWVLPRLTRLLPEKRTNCVHKIITWWSRHADRWMLPVDLKGQRSNPLRLSVFCFAVTGQKRSQYRRKLLISYDCLVLWAVSEIPVILCMDINHPRTHTHTYTPKRSPLSFDVSVLQMWP